MIRTRGGLPIRVCVLSIAATPIAALSQIGGPDPLSTSRLVPPRLPADAPKVAGSCALPARVPVLDLTLLVAAALCNDPRIDTSWASVKAAAADVGLSRTNAFPTVQYTGTAYKLFRNVETPGVQVIGEPGNTLTQRFDAGVTDQSLTLSYILFDFGQQRANRRNARALLNAVIASHDLAIQTTLYDVSETYYRYITSLQRIEAARQQLALAERTSGTVRELHKAGLLSSSDELQSEVQRGRATVAVTEALRGADEARLSLTALTRIPPEALAGATLPPEESASLRREALARLEARIGNADDLSPSLARADANRTAAEANVAVARAQGRPVLSAAGTIKRSDTPVGVSQKQIFTDRYAGLTLDVPIFDGFANRYRKARARAELQAREGEATAARYAFENAVGAGLVNSRSALRQLEQAEQN